MVSLAAWVLVIYTAFDGVVMPTVVVPNLKQVGDCLELGAELTSGSDGFYACYHPKTRTWVRPEPK